MKRFYFLPLSLLIFFSSCIPFGEPPEENPPQTIQGYAPIYDSTGSVKIIRSDTARNIIEGGKIYVKGKILYQVEAGKGIHVISIANPANPVKLQFLQIFGCQELSIKDNYLYTNNLNDLIVVDIADISGIQVKDRIPDAFRIVNHNPPSAGWHECVEASRGTIIGWKIKTLHYPQCNYNP